MNFRFSAWELSVGAPRLEMFACDFPIGDFRLRSFSCYLSLGNFSLGTFAWDLWLGYSRVGCFTWYCSIRKVHLEFEFKHKFLGSFWELLLGYSILRPEAGGPRLSRLGELAGGSWGDPQVAPGAIL